MKPNRIKIGSVCPINGVFLGYKSKKKIDGSIREWERWGTDEQYADQKRRMAKAMREWRSQNPHRARQSRKNSYYKNHARTLEMASAYNRNARLKNPDKRKADNKKWRRDNREHVTAKARERKRSRMASDPAFKLKSLLRRRLSSFLSQSGFIKDKSISVVIGCSSDVLRSHIESKFSHGMSWSNKALWHIDHIIPLKSEKTEQGIYRLFHYSNLQPLWGPDNLRKGSKMPHELMS